MPPDAQRRRNLLDQLEAINAALERREAVPDITVDEARGIREIATLGHIVDASARRLAVLMETSGWTV
jgi:hypothetical protein